MKKRLRKKLRLLEFQEMGFTLSFDVDCNNPETYGPLYARLSEFLNKEGLTTVFGYGDLFVRTKREYQSVSETNRKVVAAWMQKQPEAIQLSFGRLADHRLTQLIHRRKAKWKPIRKR